MVCRSVKYFPKQVQSEITNPGKWHRIVIFTVNWWKTKKKRFTITENFAIYLNIAMDYDFSKFENDITVESGLQSWENITIFEQNVISSPSLNSSAQFVFQFFSNLSDLCVIFYVPISM